MGHGSLQKKRKSSYTFGLLSVQFVEPIFHMAEGTKQAKPRFGQIQPGVQCVSIFLAFIDAGQLLGLGSHLRLSAWARAGSIAQLKL